LCGDLWIVLREPGRNVPLQAINGHCDDCSYRLAWLLVRDVVLGGGNVKKLKVLPKGCREGDNANAFLGGFRLWQKARRLSRLGKAISYPKGNQ
jgi:hypothetical protein